MSNQLNLIVLDNRLEQIDYLTDIISLVWSPAYYETGDYVLKVKASERNLKLITNGALISKDYHDEPGIIEDYTLEYDDIDGKYITVTGRLLSAMTKYRVVPSYHQMYYPSIGHAISGSCITLPGDMFGPIFELNQESIGNPTYVTYNVDQTSFDVISYLCNFNQLGFAMRYDNTQDIYGLYAYQGKDTGIELSDKYGQIRNYKIKNVYSPIVSEIIVLGSSEEILDPIFSYVGKTTDWIHTKQKLLDCRQISQGSQAYSVYSAKMIEMGKSEYVKQNMNADIELELDIPDSKMYKQDWNVGDLLTIKLYDLNLEFKKRIIRVDEVYEENSVNFIPILN